LTGLICLRIGTGGRLLWTRWWTFIFHKMWGVRWPSEDLLASEGLCLMVLAGRCFERPSSALQRRTSWTYFMDRVGTFECACTVDQVLLPIIMCQLWCVLCALSPDFVLSWNIKILQAVHTACLLHVASVNNF
jgi:hypothetical protein